ncbi:MAG: GNAT family N-acetyltransferase [Candidatus Diapherotrites archaeon]|nr:GNAT family N-acetyltransferase [Candidatus Diapherotrites archaeon]
MPEIHGGRSHLPEFILHPDKHLGGGIYLKRVTAGEHLRRLPRNPGASAAEEDIIHIARATPYGSHGSMDLRHGFGVDNTLVSLSGGRFEGMKSLEIRRDIPSEHRGRGIGTQMLVEAERIGREQGFDVLWAHTASDNLGARRSYEHARWTFVREYFQTGEGQRVLYVKFLNDQ